MTKGPNVPIPGTKYKRSCSIFPVTSIALICGRVWPQLLQLLAQSLIGSPDTLECSAQKRPAKDAPKIAVHLSNPRGRTWTARDQFSAPFAVVKQYHIAGNTVVKSCLKIRNNDDRDFSPKMTFIRTLKIFREFGMCSKSLGTN